jgi:hypothetical protein
MRRSLRPGAQKIPPPLGVAATTVIDTAVKANAHTDPEEQHEVKLTRK